MDVKAAAKAQQAVVNGKHVMMCVAADGKLPSINNSVVAEQLQDNVSIICGNIIDTSLSQATVIFIYLLPKGIVRLLHKLQTELRPGCRVVTYMFR